MTAGSHSFGNNQFTKAVVRRCLPITIVIVCVSALILATGYKVLSQTASMSPREALVESVKESARRDAGLERAPASPQDLYLLFGKDAEQEGLLLRDIVTLYNDAYQIAKKEKSWWRVLLPTSGWLIAIILFLLLIFRDALRDAIKGPVSVLAEQIYYRVFANILFQKGKLKRYRRALAKKYKEFRVPFGHNRVLDLTRIYVPLKVKGSDGNDQLDASSVLNRYNRLVVLGAPGAGKSMLLKKIALSYATEGARRSRRASAWTIFRRKTALPYGTQNSKSLYEERVPVLLELRRLNNVEKPIEEHLADVLELNGFRKARHFVDSSLEQGNLFLLLDGLDEVNSAKRVREVEKIKDLLTKYRFCRALVTCRTAVYKNDFAEEAEQTLEIVEFSDQQIQMFLGAWPGIPQEKPIEQLLIALRERPRIMSLARNPLLLTIIAFLYVDLEEFVLPHSRTEFYTRAVNVLLQMKEELNQYTVNNKLLVLEHLAVFNQERGTQDTEDRLSLDLKTVLNEVNRVLPQLNLETKDASLLMKEIVERSGILLEIDNKTRYQFSHLTLQEYFTGSGLRQDGSRLLANFERDPDAWGETVKLWCGFPHDSSHLIKAIYEREPVAAFECLADVQKIDQELAETIVNSFKTRLNSTEDSSDLVVNAFAAVASGPSQRSHSVFDYLVDILTSSAIYAHRMAVARALSLTNQPKAARALADLFPEYPELSPEVVRMGDLAVPALGNQAQRGSSIALWALYTIGTPKAARSLVPLLWVEGSEENAVLSGQAALILGSLLDRDNVEKELADYLLTADEKSDLWHPWAWRPFERSSTSSLSLITGRISWLLDSSMPVDVGTISTIDKRIVIPLCVEARNRFDIGPLDAVASMTGEEALEALGPLREGTFDVDKALSHDQRIAVAKSDLLSALRQDPDEWEGRNPPGKENVLSFLRIFRFVPPSLKPRFLKMLFSRPLPTLDHWKSVRDTTHYSFNKSGHIIAVWSVTIILSILSFCQLSLWAFQSSPLLSLKTIALLALLGFQGIATILALSGGEEYAEGLPDAQGLLATYGAFVYFPYTELWQQKRLIMRGSSYVEVMERGLFLLRGVSTVPKVIATAFYVCFTPLIVCSATVFMLRGFSPLQVISIWALSCSIVILSLTLGLRKERRASNPLRALFERGEWDYEHPIHKQ